MLNLNAINDIELSAQVLVDKLPELAIKDRKSTVAFVYRGIKCKYGSEGIAHLEGLVDWTRALMMC